MPVNFLVSASAANVPGLQTDPALILQGANWLISLLTLHPKKSAYQQHMKRASNRLVASDWFCRGVVVLKQTECE